MNKPVQTAASSAVPPEAVIGCPEVKQTVFDLLYDGYLPFRLYADYMLGKSAGELAKQFGLPEHWIAERIEAVRLCLGKQVRLNLLEPALQGSRAVN